MRNIGKSNDQLFCYFVLHTINEYDVFTNLKRKEIVTNALNYFIAEKDLRVFVWLLMSNTLHIIVKSENGKDIQALMYEFKEYTSKRMNLLMDEKNDANSKTIQQFLMKGQLKELVLWEDVDELVKLSDGESIDKTIHDIHYIPVNEKIVESPEHYLFSSAGDFLGWNGFVDVDNDI